MNIKFIPTKIKSNKNQSWRKKIIPSKLTIILIITAEKLNLISIPGNSLKINFSSRQIKYLTF